MNSAYDFKSKVHVKRESHELEEEDGAYVSKPGTNACIASNHKSLHVCFFWIVTEGDLSAFQQDYGRRKNHWVDSRTTRREDNGFQTMPAGRTTSIAFGKKESPNGIPSCWDRQKGSRISMEVARRDLKFQLLYKRNRQMGFQVVWIKEIARRDLVFRWRSPEGTSCFSFGKRNCPMGFQVIWDRQKGSRTSTFIKEGR